MTSLAWLIPAALVLGGLGLAAFLWSLKSGQYEDLDGAAWRALEDRAPSDAHPRSTPGPPIKAEDDSSAS
ncbi:MAG: cbb3-type cytochrome oxidase assembly protein CcoS [Hyphomicrobiaceae bacterium]|nr:cbb3-type cytochrome oxidase assembly protein CcoS [Hyphomicrobiaceae bacterium]